MDKKILKLSGEIEEIKISSDIWRSIHEHRGITHFYKKGFSLFLERYNLQPIYFNLNCLDKLKGVILTESQILKINTVKGGIKKWK